MRDYNPRWIDRVTYNRIVWAIRDYYNLKERYQAILDESSSGTGGGSRSSLTSDNTGAKAVKLVDISKQLDAIEKAQQSIPDEYMQGVWNSLVYRKPYPLDADRTTYSRWKRIYIIDVGKRLGYL